MKWKIHPGNTSFQHDSIFDWTSWHHVRQVRVGMKGLTGDKSQNCFIADMECCSF